MDFQRNNLFISFFLLYNLFRIDWLVTGMILKKPYGFLIKHFRMIHLILFVLSLYLTIKVNSVLHYYNDFIGESASKLDALNYVSNYYIIAIVFSILICLIVYALMRYKKKPRLLYLLFILLYFGIGVCLQIGYSGLHTIYISVLETKTLRFYRDLLQILVLIQYFSLPFLLIRGLGFDIKKFNFVSDLAELGEDSRDSEEVELTLEGNGVTQRKIHRGIRELKYYYLENKLFIHIILIILVVVGLSTFTIDKEVVNKVYREGENFSSDTFNFQVENSYLTNQDYKDSLIGDLQHTFVVVRLFLSPKGGDGLFNEANLILNVGNNSYSPISRYSGSFKDLGSVYQSQKIKSGSSYLFVYSVLNEETNAKMKLTYADTLNVLLSPVNLEKENKKESLKLGEKLDLSSTVMKSGYLSILSFSVQSSFSYSYQYEVRGEVFDGEYSILSSNGSILKLEMDSSYFDSSSNYDFLANYASLKYKIGEKDYSSDFYDKTPGDYRKGVYLAVSKDLANADCIWFEVRIRNNTYMYFLKEK